MLAMLVEMQLHTSPGGGMQSDDILTCDLYRHLLPRESVPELDASGHHVMRVNYYTRYFHLRASNKDRIRSSLCRADTDMLHAC